MSAALPLARRVVRRLADAGLTLATAESLTGGALAAAVVDVPGASAVLRGGVVAYATDLKAELLGVDPDLLSARGAVDPEVARQMADGVRRRLGADVGLATTGVAGPAGQDGRPPGTVHLAVALPGLVGVRSLVIDGDRSRVRRGSVALALGLVLAAVPAGASTGGSAAEHVTWIRR